MGFAEGTGRRRTKAGGKQAARQPKYVEHQLPQRRNNGTKRRQVEVQALAGVSPKHCFEGGDKPANEPAGNQLGGLPVARE